MYIIEFDSCFDIKMKVQLSKERDSLAMTAKKLGRDLAKVRDSSKLKMLVFVCFLISVLLT
jgi:hypothetical protein